MLLDQPFAGPAQPQACAVDQQVNRSSGAWTWLWDLQGLGTPAQGRVIRHRQIQTQELEDRADQTLRLTQAPSRNTARSVSAVLIARAE